MNKIGSYEEYKEIIEPYRRNHIYSNVYFLKSAIQEMIDSESLYYMVLENNLYLFQKEDGFLRLFYYIMNTEISERFPLSDTMVVEFVYKDEMSSEKETEVQFLEKLGFKLGRHSCRLELKSEDVIRKSEDCDMTDIAVDYARGTDADRISALLRESFNPLYAYIPDLEELQDIIANKRIMVVRHKDGIAGVLHSEIQKSNIMLWQIAVDKNCRGKGIGRILLDEWHRIYKDSVKAFVVWTDSDNSRALNMYTTEGYKQDGRYSDEYILV